MIATTSTRRALSAAAVLALGLGLTACGSGTQDTSASPSASASGTAEASASGLKIEQPWAKAADSGMSAAFAKITNTTDHEITIVSASSTASRTVQLHETVTDQSGSSTMQEKKGGFVLEPGASTELKPGGNHIMFMDLTCSLKAGNDIKVTVRTKDGAETTFDVPVRDYSAAQEHYDASARPSASGSSSQSMDMKGMDMGSASASALPECHA